MAFNGNKTKSNISRTTSTPTVPAEILIKTLQPFGFLTVTYNRIFLPILDVL